MSSSNTSIDVLIVGSGPVGLTCAVEAQRLGLSARIIDRKTERSTHDSRALVVHARVLELLEPMGSVTQKIVDSSLRGGKIQIHLGKDDIVEASFDEGDWGDTQYPSPSFLPQYDTEKMLEDELQVKGGAVEYGTSLETLEQDEEAGIVRSTIRNKDGKQETVTSKYVIGCDGGRSKTRELLGIDLHRIDSGVYFIVGDIHLKVSPFDDDARACVFPTTLGTCAFLSLSGKNNYRIVALTPEGITDKSDLELSKDFFEKLLRERTGFDKIEVELGKWQTIFHVRHGVASSFSKGRVFLAGDACHVHSPVGGQGMNYGMQDAINLLWKLAWAERAAARDASMAKESTDFILRSYADERHALGLSLIKGVGILTKVVTSRNWFLIAIRNFMLRNVFPIMSKSGVRKISQLDLKYEPSSSDVLFENGYWSKSFICKPGERLPNLRLEDGTLLHSHIDRVRHTWIFLNTDAPPTSLGGMKAVSVTPLDEEKQCSIPVISQSTLRKPQVILVRPDLFVAGVDISDQSLWKRTSESVDVNSLETM